MSNRLGDLISIGIPTYNRSQYLRNLLLHWEAFLTLHSIQVVVSDNSDDDKTQKMLNEFGERFSVIYSRNIENIGMDRNFNKVVSMAKTPWVWLLGDDDLQDPETLSRHKEILEDSSVGFIVINSQSIDQTGEMIEAQIIPKTVATGKYDVPTFMRACGWYLGYVGGMIVRRDKWIAIDCEKYFGTFFSHAGIALEYSIRDEQYIFVESSPRIKYLAGNANWTSRFFEIQFKLWQDMVRILAPPVPKRELNGWKNSVPLKFVGLRSFAEARASGSFGISQWLELVFPFWKGIPLMTLRGHQLAMFSLVVSLLPKEIVKYFMVHRE